MSWINWTLLSCACSRITAAGTCSYSRWGISKADDQWIDTRMYWCSASVGCRIMEMNFLGFFWLPHGWMWLVWAVDRMWYCVNTAEKVMRVKGYAHSMRTHELTLQALWPILLPRLNDHLDSIHEELGTELWHWRHCTENNVHAIDEEEDDNDDDDYTHTMRPPQVRGQRVTDEGRLVTSLKQRGVFHNKSQTPQIMMNKDVVIATIQKSPLSAESEHSIKPSFIWIRPQHLLRLHNSDCARRPGPATHY